MAPARQGLEPKLRELPFADLAAPLYRNVDAKPVTDADEVRDGLIRQVDAPVLWTETVQKMRADGIDTFIEVGTGTVLSGLVKRVDRAATVLSAGTCDTIDKALAELGLAG